jgi:hypothetical protein
MESMPKSAPGCPLNYAPENLINKDVDRMKQFVAPPVSFYSDAARRS